MATIGAGPLARIVAVCLLVLTLAAGLFVDPLLMLVLLMGYVVLSVVLFAAYGLDKRAARRGTFRTQESALHLLALMGGWPGGMLGQQVFRHKTIKTSFQIGF